MTRLIEILISLAIVLAMFLLVALVLPSSRHLEEKVETNRKLTIVYDTLNSLRRFPDWNPLVLRDPQMDLKFSGPASGVGARLDYSSDKPNLGDGSWEIIATQPRASVTYSLVNPQRGHYKVTTFSLKPTGAPAATSRSPRATTSPMAGTCWAATPACTSAAMSATTSSSACSA